MRKSLLLAVFLSAVVASAYAGIAAATDDTVVRTGALVFTIDGSSGFAPMALSRSAYTPVAFTAAGSVRDLDSAEPWPPPLEEVLLDVKNVAVNTTGYPTCAGGTRDIRRAQDVRGACPDSIIGSGTATVSIKFPEQEPTRATSPLLVFNGGTSGGTTTLYIHAYLTQPITTAIVATVEIEKAGGGSRAVATIPKIANGAGSVTDFSLKIDKKYAFKGKKASVLSAKCVGGKIQAQVTAKFYDSSQVSVDIPQTCASKP